MTSVSIVKTCGDTSSKFLAGDRVMSREIGGTGPVADDVMETLVEKGEVSTLT